MKIWNSYGSEHSSAIVIIGRFTTAEYASDFMSEFEKLETQLQNENLDLDVCEVQDHFPDELLKLIGTEKIKYCHDFAPKDLNDLFLEYHKEIDQSDPRVVRFTSDDTGWAGLIKMLINAGAHVEIFSQHNEKKANA